MEHSFITMKDDPKFSANFIKKFLDYPEEQKCCIVGRGFRSGDVGETIDFIQKYDENMSGRSKI